MIEQIKAYNGYERAMGQIKMSILYLYRCTKCGEIKLTSADIKEHDCKKKALNENRSMQ
jgi:hypothetical protein